MLVNVKQLFSKAWSLLPSIRKKGPGINTTIVSNRLDINDTEPTFKINNKPISSVSSVVLPLIDPVSRKIKEIPFLSPCLPAWEVVPDVHNKATTITLGDDLTCPIEINLNNLPGLRKRIFGSKDLAVTMATKKAFDEIGYCDSSFFYEGVDTDFNLEYLKDLQDIFIKREALIKLFGEEEDINKYPRYLVAFCNKHAKASRELFRHRFGQLACEHRLEDIELLKFLMTNSGVYSEENNLPYKRAKELAKSIEGIDELVVSGQKQFWQMLRNIKAGIKSSTSGRDDDILALFEWLNNPQERKENAKVIYALQILDGELVEIYADEKPNNFSRILDAVEAECRNCFLEILDNRFDLLTQVANVPQPQPQILKTDDCVNESSEEIVLTNASSPSQATCDFVVTEGSLSAEQAVDAENINLTNVPKTTEVKMTVGDVLELAKDSTIDIVREVFRRECVLVTAREKQLVDEYNQALAEAELREELETDAEKGRDVIWRREFLKWGGVAVVGVTGLGLIGYRVKTYFDEEARLRFERDARLLAIKQLKSDIEAALNPGFDEYIKQAEDDLKIKKEKKTNMRETYCWYLSYYLERNPTDAELRKELKFFIENEKKIYKNGITMDPEVRRLITGFLNSTITSDELADGLLELDPMRQKMLPHPLHSLQTIRAINTGRATHMPGDLKGKVIHDLRDLFTLKEWNVCWHLQEQEIDGEQIPRQQITPTIGQLIGTGSLVHGGSGFLTNFIEANYGREKLFPGFDQPYVSRSRASLQILRQKLEERIKGDKHNYENSSEAQELSDWNSRLDNVSSIDALREAAETIRPLIDILRGRKQKREPVIKGLAKCFVLAQDLESMINVRYNELTNVPKK